MCHVDLVSTNRLRLQLIAICATFSLRRMKNYSFIQPEVRHARKYIERSNESPLEIPSKKVAEEVRSLLSPRATHRHQKLVAMLVVGDDPASQVYVTNKERAVKSRHRQLPRIGYAAPIADERCSADRQRLNSRRIGQRDYWSTASRRHRSGPRRDLDERRYSMRSIRMKDVDAFFSRQRRVC